MFRNKFNILNFIQHYKSRAGFTLIEVAIVVGILAVLTTVIYVAVKPANRIGDTNNAVRSQDVKAVEKAIKSFLVDSATSSTTISDLSEGIYYSLGIDGSADGSYACSQLDDASIVRKDIASELSPYLGTLPIDPDISSGDDTGYYLLRTGNLFDVGYCNWYDPNAVIVAGNGPPVEPDPDDGRTPTDTQTSVGVFTDLVWADWDDPDLDIVEYEVLLYKNTQICSGSPLDTYSWGTAITWSPDAYSFLTYYSWKMRARSQGESDETAYNDCYWFYTQGL